MNKKKRGKHKNLEQCDIFQRFMERRPDLAKGFAKGDRVCHEQQWEELTAELNGAGPPVKDLAVWKKTWADWKLNIRRRLSHNKAEGRKTGGGRFNQYVLTPVEEEIASICGLYKAVDGIANTKRFGVCQKQNAPCNDGTEVPTTSMAAPTFTSTRNDLLGTSRGLDVTANVDIELDVSNLCSPLAQADGTNISAITSPASSVRARTRRRSAANLNDVFQMEKENFDELAKKVHKMGDEVKKNGTQLRDINKNLKYLSKDVTSLSKDVHEIRLLKEKKFEEMQRHHFTMEKSLKSKNELKLKFLVLEKLKLGVPE